MEFSRVHLLALFSYGMFLASQASSQDCGVQTAPLNQETKIVGGRPAQEGEWPWQALIVNGNSAYGGILVHPQWVLTWPADHRTSTTTVYMGSNNMDNSPSSNVQYRTVSQRFVHPKWNADLDFNVALLKLSSPFTITNYVRTVCVPTSGMSFSAGTSCIAAGWGTTSENDPYQNPDLYEVEVEVTSKSYCRQRYSPYGIHVSDSMVCAEGEAGKGICAGDGPLVSQVGSLWYVVGVPSWGNGCARAGYPAVYTYAPPVYNWMAPIFDGQNPDSGSSVIAPSILILVTALVLAIFAGERYQ